VRASGGIDYATEAMKKLVQEAITILHQFPVSSFRTSLEGLVDYTIERNK
jgi:octaprenyl-diphosphate synthase